jgi:hypothetical protein
MEFWAKKQFIFLNFIKFIENKNLVTLQCNVGNNMFRL